MINKLQHPPNAVQIEFVEGCPLACSFCGIQGIRDNGANGPEGIMGTNSKPYKFMKKKTARLLAKQIKEAGWNPRMEFALRGEPTVHPKAAELLSIFRKKLPKLPFMMTSNGFGLLKSPGITKNINALFDAGLNVLLLDDYDHTTIVKKIIKKYKGPHQIYHYPQQKSANPHRRRKPTEHEIIIEEDVSHNPGGTHGALMNHAGCSFPPNDRQQGKRCARPFREISVRYNGKIAVCCMDWRGFYHCGDIYKTPIGEIWQNKYFRAARKALYHGLRTFGPCNGCDTRSYRPGLLPDRMGKEELPKPTKKTWKIIEKALSHEPYTKPVKRPWEE